MTADQLADLKRQRAARRALSGVRRGDRPHAASGLRLLSVKGAPVNRTDTRERVAAEQERRRAATAARLEEVEALLARPALDDGARAALRRERAALLRRRGPGNVARRARRVTV
jgi:hypothetical protein